VSYVEPKREVVAKLARGAYAVFVFSPEMRGALAETGVRLAASTTDLIETCVRAVRKRVSIL
jgi:hypothetical protein